MDSLASHLGMSKRTIYEIFADKDELLIGVLNGWLKTEELVKKCLRIGKCNCCNIQMLSTGIISRK